MHWSLWCCCEDAVDTLCTVLCVSPTHVRWQSRIICRWFMQLLSGRPLSIVCPSTHISWDRCPCTYSRDFGDNVIQMFHHVSGHCWKGCQGQRLEVRGHEHWTDQFTCNGKDVHFDSTALRVTCLNHNSRLTNINVNYTMKHFTKWADQLHQLLCF